jgi:hypothetical protein
MHVANPPRLLGTFDMSRRHTTSPISPIRSWSRRLPSLAAAAILSVATSRAGAQQAQLGAPVPMGAPTSPASPVQPPTAQYLPAPGGSPLQPSSLQSRQTVAATPKVADQKAIQLEPIIPPGGAPQPTMAELRQSLRDEGIKNMGMPDFMRQPGAKPPTPPAGMTPVTPPSGWSRLFSRSPDTTETASATTTTATPPPSTVRTEPPVVQQTSGTAPPDQQSWWYRLTHRSTPNEAPQPTGPMVLPEATPLRMQ